MGVKKALYNIAGKAGDGIAKLSSLSPQQIREIEDQRNAYLTEMPDPNNLDSQTLTERLLAANAVEIYNAYLPQISALYTPVEANAEYQDKPFDPQHNIRYFNITKWVTDKRENSLTKLVNVYDVLSNEKCNIALVFHRSTLKTDVYLTVVNTDNANNNTDIENYKNRLADALHGNFPGSVLKENDSKETIPCLKHTENCSVASVSNVPSEKSEKYISQTIEKLLDGYVPHSKEEEYTLILLATPVLDAEDRKLDLADFYSGLAPYSKWSTNYTYVTSDSRSSSASFGVNAGISAGVQNGNSEAVSRAKANALSKNETESHNKQDTISNNKAKIFTHGDSHSETNGITNTISGSGSIEVGHFRLTVSDSLGISSSFTDSMSESESTQYAESIAKSTGKSISKSLGKAITNTISNSETALKNKSLGGNFGANFARSSNVMATVGRNEGITQSFTNFSVEHTLEILKEEMKRLDESEALGLWDFGAYVVSEDVNMASNVAHSYLALTQGEKSYLSKGAVNIWRGDTTSGGDAETICAYLKYLRHPVFGMNPEVLKADNSFCEYPSVVTATTSLTGKELAYALNFPAKSVSGLPVFQCAEFGRNVVTYDEITDPEKIRLGDIFHMNHVEPGNRVDLSKQSLASHTFITGSTGSGKSNTVYQILHEAEKQGVSFLVVEPAKGEYKDVFGQDEDVSVYGTNPAISELLRINPFSFEKGIHVLEHLDRLVEIFNVCWPMYAAMPAVLKEAIIRSYEDCGWDMTNSTNRYGEDMYPRFADVARNIKTIIDSSEYDAENKGAYKGSLLTRLQSLTNGINGMIFTSNEISSENLFDKKVIVDLSRVGSTETKSLIMGLLVLKLQEYRMSSSDSFNSQLKHLTVLEEAHNLLKRTSSEQPVEGGNLLGKSVEMLANAIAEMRTYGEGFIIADQAPGLLDMSVIRNTNTKIIMRLPDQGDRELVGKAANLNQDQITELAKLPCGVGAVYQNEWIQPALCKIDYFKHSEKHYEYHPKHENEESNDIDKRLTIAEILSKGTEMDHETVMHDIKPELDAMNMKASTEVLAMQMMEEPSEEPRMTKLSIVMNDLFPTVDNAFKKAYHQTDDCSEWTDAAVDELFRLTNRSIDDQLRRDIIQCAATYCFYNEMGKEELFDRWAAEGDLR